MRKKDTRAIRIKRNVRKYSRYPKKKIKIKI